VNEIPIRAACVSVLALRPGNDGWRVLLLRRAGAHLPGVWSYVSGGIEAGERAWQTALRELSEETGLVPLELYSADVCEQFYEPQEECVLVFPVFVALVDPEMEVILNQEHSEATWANLAEGMALLPFPGQRHTLRDVWAEFVERQPLEHLRIPLPANAG
jgi:dihydroneopterin triphosphate diphosphatase